jgi:hypothetical protein
MGDTSIDNIKKPDSEKTWKNVTIKQSKKPKYYNNISGFLFDEQSVLEDDTNNPNKIFQPFRNQNVSEIFYEAEEESKESRPS